MMKFKVRVISGGVYRQTFTVEAASIEACAVELNAEVKEVRPGWAFVHYGPLSSAEITWDS